MDAGTATLVIYLAGMGSAARSLLPPSIPTYATGVEHPLRLSMRSLEVCLQVAERERKRGNKAICYGSDPQHRA